MTATHDETPAAPRFRLQTFGTLRLVGSADETVLGDHGHQRRRLALLAVLAASGERGRSRDQLQGLFWPDVPQSRARHSLEQLLYAIRTSLDASVFIGVNPIRLNADFIGSDVADFTAALERGDFDVAADLYSGRFLEGFYLGDAQEFEQWMDAERRGMEHRYIGALEQLARSAEDANDSAAVARWRQKLIEADPLSSKHATGLIRALMNNGDHAAALKYAERYEALMAQELGTSVGPEVGALVAEVRARAKTGSVVVRGAVPPAPLHPETFPYVPPAPGADEPAAKQDGPIAAPVRVRKRTAPVYGVAAVALAALVGAALWLSPRGNDGAVAPMAGVSIAVLPLANLSGDPRDAALADGLTEELIGVLAKVDRLRVVARTSAFAFKNSDLDARQIGDSLHVSNILEGGVQKSGQRIRVLVRLVDARDGSTRWSETYDRELKDIFLVQSDIAATVARELDLRLGGRVMDNLRRVPTRNVAAYELYLRANDPALLRSDSSARLALQYFTQAIALDPAYAAAHAGLARMYGRLIGAEGAAIPRRELQARARAAALKAVALDDSLAEAHAALGLVLIRGHDLAAAENELRRAVALDPGNSRLREWLTFIYHWKQDRAGALAEANRALANDPLSPTAHAEVARALCANGQHAAGLARLKLIEAVKPPLGRGMLYVGLCHAMQLDWPAAVATLRNSTQPLSRAFLGHALARGGDRQEALAILADLTGRWDRVNQGAFEIAIVHAGLGNREQAFAWLNRSIDDFSLPVPGHIMLPLFSDLHADPRFESFRRRLRLQNR